MDRNNAIFEKVQEINESFNYKYNRVQGTDSTESKLASTKKKMDFTIARSKEEIEQILMNATALLKKAEHVNAEYDHQSNLQLQMIKQISHNATEKLEIEILSRKEKQNSIMNSFEQKIQFLKKQIEKERKTREQLFSQVTSTLEEDLPTIMTEILDNKDAFDETHEKIEGTAEQLLEESQKHLKQFTQDQQENSQKAFTLIKDLTKKIKIEFEQEKMACDSTHDEVINYVEEACNRISVDGSF